MQAMCMWRGKNLGSKTPPGMVISVLTDNGESKYLPGRFCLASPPLGTGMSLPCSPALDNWRSGQGPDFLGTGWIFNNKIRIHHKTCQLMPYFGGFGSCLRWRRESWTKSNPSLYLLSWKPGCQAELHREAAASALSPASWSIPPTPHFQTPLPSTSRHQMAPSLCLSPSRKFEPLPVPVRGSKPQPLLYRDRHPGSISDLSRLCSFSAGHSHPSLPPSLHPSI